MDLTEFNELEARRRAHARSIGAVIRRLVRQDRPLTQAENDYLAEMGRAYEQLGRDAQDAIDRARGLI